MLNKIKLENVSVIFQTEAKHKETHRRGFFSKKKNVNIKAIDDISIEISEGERVGLIGLNGAGKSTLLRVMAGIYKPHSGDVEIQGHVNPMFEFATGVELEMTGWENIILRGQLLGIPYDEIVALSEEIGKFTELGEFLDYPVKTYSSGMFARLAFSISTAIKPEILLLDEVVGAGDLKFEKKASKRVNDLLAQGSIIVFTSHNMHLLQMFCERTIWLEKGRVKMDGITDDVIKEYLASK